MNIVQVEHLAFVWISVERVLGRNQSTPISSLDGRRGVVQARHSKGPIFKLQEAESTRREWNWPM